MKELELVALLVPEHVVNDFKQWMVPRCCDSGSWQQLKVWGHDPSNVRFYGEILF
jgi:hypothetical protein